MEAKDNDGMAIAVGCSDICRGKGFPDYLSPTGGHKSEKKKVTFLDWKVGVRGRRTVKSICKC